MLMVLFSQACQLRPDAQTSQTTQTSQTVERPLPGSDRSPQGCIGSAGYVWSRVKDSCIRPFEQGSPFFKYDPATGMVDSTSASYIVLSASGDSAELFFSITEKPALMKAVPVMEGETMPVLYEDSVEMVKLRYYRDTYQIIYMDSIRYIQFAGATRALKRPTH